MIGIVVGIYFLHRDSVRPYSWYALLPMVLAGFVIAVMKLDPLYQLVAPWGICSTWLLGIGTWTLFGYLRAHPKPHPGQEDRL